MLTDKKYMIFHFPLKLDYEAKEASGIRPIKMLNAFKEAGYEVIEITGYSTARKRKIRKIKNEITYGKKIDFVYSETSPVLPSMLTDPHHFPSFVDLCFFYFCKRKNIPIGLFYRDIYWKFSGYVQLGSLKIKIIKLFSLYEIYCYAKILKRLYIPSMGMAEYFGKFPKIIDELPPGCDCIELEITEDKKNQCKSTIDFLYIGGFGNLYRLHNIYKAIAYNDRFTLTICARKNEWDLCSSEYIKNNEVPSNIRIVHFWGNEIKKLYKKADIAVLYIEPIQYRNFAVPFKLYEYIGFNKPILASDATYVGTYVSRMNIGWTIQYDTDAINNFLKNITHDEIIQKKINVSKIAANSRWVDRAKKVIGDMIG